MAALAAWLEEAHGLSSVLFSYGEWRETLLKRRPRVVAMTHLKGSRNETIAASAKKSGAAVVVIQTEGRPNNLELMQYMIDGLEGDRIDLWFTWSDTVRDFMLQRGVLSSDRVFTAGAHRFDIYRSPLN